MPARLICFLLVVIWPLLVGAQSPENNASAIVVTPGEVRPSVAAKIHSAMEHCENWNTAGWTIDELARQMQKRLDCPVTVDQKALQNYGLTGDTRIPSWKMTNLSRGSLLRQALDEVDLTWMIVGGRVEITTHEAAESQLNVFIFPVADLISVPSFGPEAYEYDSLINLIPSVVSPESWPTGPITPIEPYAGSLVIAQTNEIGIVIGDLINTLRQVKETATNHAKVKQISYRLASEGGQRPDLHQRVTISPRKLPLGEAVRELGRVAEINTRVDTRSIEEVGTKEQQLVQLEAENEPLSSVLQRLTRPLKLDWTYQDDVLVIATTDEIENRPIIRVYPVQDLVAAERHTFKPSWWRASDEFDTLISTIKGSVDTSRWDNAAYSIASLANPKVLVISQRLQVHEQIEGLIAGLRRAKEIEQGVWKRSAEEKPVVRLERFRLAKDVPARKTAKLLRELFPECPMIRPFGQGLLVRGDEADLLKMYQMLEQLGLIDLNDMRPQQGGFDAGGFQ